MPLWRLYQRITRTRGLKHQHRSRIVELATARPGIVVADVARELGISYHTAGHHVRVLKRCGVLDVVRTGHRVALYPPGELDHPAQRALVSLRRGPQAVALRLVVEQRGLRVIELAARTGCTKSSASEKLRLLRAQGLIEPWNKGFQVTRLGEEALRLLALEESRAAVAAARRETTTTTS